MSKHPTEWAMDRIAAMRRNGRTPFKIAKYALRDAELFEFPVEQLDLTPDERAAIDRARAAATPNKKPRS
jgi:hypothetical protein